MVIQTFNKDSLFAGFFVGDYELDGGTYTEHIKSAISYQMNMIGKSMVFDIELEGDFCLSKALIIRMIKYGNVLLSKT